jgi:hypothetical protein
VRLRQLPLTPERVLTALKAAGAGRPGQLETVNDPAELAVTQRSEA